MTIELLNCDCMEYMAALPDKAFDLAIVDPPYGLNMAEGTKTRGKGKVYKKNDWDNTIPAKEYWASLFRVSAAQIVWGGNYMTEFLPPSMGWIVWNKCQGAFSLADGELAWTSFDRALRIFDCSRSSMMQDGREHPTQKPIKLYEWLLTNYAKPGQRILDTHLGSGSSAIAAHNLGFDFVGCERDKDYCDTATAWLKREQANTKLFPAELPKNKPELKGLF